MGLQEKLKYSNLVLRTSKIVDFRNLPEILYRNSRILPYITVRDRGGTAIYTSFTASFIQNTPHFCQQMLDWYAGQRYSDNNMYQSPGVSWIWHPYPYQAI